MKIFTASKLHNFRGNGLTSSLPFWPSYIFLQYIVPYVLVQNLIGRQNLSFIKINMMNFFLFCYLMTLKQKQFESRLHTLVISTCVVRFLNRPTQFFVEPQNSKDLYTIYVVSFLIIVWLSTIKIVKYNMTFGNQCFVCNLEVAKRVLSSLVRKANPPLRLWLPDSITRVRTWFCFQTNN